MITKVDKNSNLIVAGDLDYMYFLDTTVSEELKQIYHAREIVNRIQRSRKDAGVKIDDKIAILLEFEEETNVQKSAVKQKEFI